MAVREILKMGHPCLRQIAKEVDKSDFGSVHLKVIIEDMIDSMIAAGGVGIAAPQIGISFRISVIEIPESRLNKEDKVALSKVKILEKTFELPEIHSLRSAQEPQIGQSELPPLAPPTNNADPLQRIIFINPRLKVIDPEEQSYWEGCLSVPGLRGKVFRPKKVFVSYFNELGKPCELTGEGFFATVLQHEFDHLDGIIYVDRIGNLKNLSYLEEFEEYHLLGPNDAKTEILD